MKHVASFLMLLFFAIACVPLETEEPTKKVETLNTAEEINNISKLMQEQEAAWNNGDLNAFMQAYVQSDSLVFIGSRGLNYGWETTLSNYKKSYPDKEKMGTLKFENEKLELLNPNAAWAAGKWNLYRTADTLSGSYMLVWKKIDSVWKIIADHSS